MSRDRGVRLQNALADYLRQWWPLAESTGSGRHGTDVTNTPGVVWECKTAAEFLPARFCRQAQAAAGSTGAVPVTVYFPPGFGAGSTGSVLAIMPLERMMGLLCEAGYAVAPEPEEAVP
jgi:hypothetical protein